MSLKGKKLGIISIVGKYRTGKSFIVNRVLLEQVKKGFKVGPTVNPCTKVQHKMHFLFFRDYGYGIKLYLVKIQNMRIWSV